MGNDQLKFDEIESDEFKNDFVLRDSHYQKMVKNIIAKSPK